MILSFQVRNIRWWRTCKLSHSTKERAQSAREIVSMKGSWDRLRDGAAYCQNWRTFVMHKKSYISIRTPDAVRDYSCYEIRIQIQRGGVLLDFTKCIWIGTREPTFRIHMLKRGIENFIHHIELKKPNMIQGIVLALQTVPVCPASRKLLNVPTIHTGEQTQSSV